MQHFFTYSPSVFEHNPHTLTQCAALQCEAVIPFIDTVVFGWESKGQRNFRAFCGNRCALDALPETHFNCA